MHKIAKYKSNKTLLLVLGACASLLELGPIITVLKDDAGILPILFAGLAYQLGNGMPHPKWLGGTVRLIFVVSLSASGIFMAQTSSLIWYVSIASLGWSLQYMRRDLAAQCPDETPSTAAKRSARVIGFALAALVDTTIWATVILATMAAAITATRKKPQFPAQNFVYSWKLGRLEWTMLVHQMHYFAYCYAVPLLVADAALGGLQYVGLWFAAGWVSYLSAETLWNRFPPIAVFLLGHTSLAGVLIVMWALQPSPVASLILWVLSGFGGGSVYCISLMHRTRGGEHAQLEKAEDLGHLFGVILAILIVLLGGNVGALPLAGGILAVFAALLMSWPLALRNLSARPRGKLG